MFSTLLGTKPPLDEESIQWIFEVFGWALRNLDADTFYRNTILVTPNNEHFPGRASSIHDMASLMFGRTLDYAGMAHWPVRLIEPGSQTPDQPVRISPPADLRGSPPDSVPVPEPNGSIPIGYDPKLVNNPEAMIAGFAQVLAHYLGSAVQSSPPGGIRNWPQTTEVLGVFLGFGVLFANTAFNHRPSACGSCDGPPAERQVFLSQFDITYALALFCALKQLPTNQLTPHLKRSLRGYFKQCRGDVERRTEALQLLRSQGKESSGWFLNLKV